MKSLSHSFLMTIIYAITLGSCINNTAIYPPLMDRDNFSELKGEIIYPKIDLLYPNGLVFAGNCLLIRDKDPQGFYKVLNLNDGNITGYMGQEGLGPGEFISMTTVKYCDLDSSIYVHDNALGKGYYFKFSPEGSFLSDSNKIGLINFRSPQSILVQDTQPLSRTTVVTNSPADGNVFSVLDSLGRRLSSFGKYPGDNSFIYDSITFPMRVQLLMDVNDKRDRFVTAGRHSDWLAFYKVDKDEVTLINEYFSRENQIMVEYNDDGRQSVYSAQYTPETIKFFTGLFSSPSYIYARYSGNSESDYDNGTYKQQCILRFTWDGDFVDGYVLDRPCGSLVVTDDDSKIIGITNGEDDERLLIEYPLPAPKFIDK